MFEFVNCAAGCGNSAISGSELCGLHCADPDAESMRLAACIMKDNVVYDLNAARLRFQNKDFSRHEFYGCNFMESVFTSCYFTGCMMRMDIFDMSQFIDCDFTKSDLRSVSFGGCLFQNCNFQDSELSHLNFCGAKIENSLYSHSNLYNSRFNGAHIIDTKMDDCNLKKTFFINSYQENSSFKSSNTAEAVFELDA